MREQQNASLFPEEKKGAQQGEKLNGFALKTKDAPAKKAKKGSPEADPDFMAFYAAYPRHEAKPDAYKAWGTLTENQKQQAIAASPKYAQQQAGTEKCYIKLPAGWLRAGRYDADFETAEANGHANGKANGHANGHRFVNENAKCAVDPDGKKRFGQNWKPYPLLPTLTGDSLNRLCEDLGVEYEDVEKAVFGMKFHDGATAIDMLDRIRWSASRELKRRHQESRDIELKTKIGEPDALLQAAGLTPHPDFKGKWLALSREFVAAIEKECPAIKAEKADYPESGLGFLTRLKECFGDVDHSLLSGHDDYGAGLRERAEAWIKRAMLEAEGEVARNRESRRKWEEKQGRGKRSIDDLLRSASDNPLVSLGLAGLTGAPRAG